MKRFLVLQNGDMEYLWDDEENVLLAKNERGRIKKLDFDLMMMSKWIPTAEEISETESRPSGWDL